MAKFKNLVDKNRLTLYLLVIIAAFGAFSVIQEKPRVSIKTVRENQMTETEKLVRENKALQNRLALLEPAEPVKIVSTDRALSPGTGIPVLAILAEGAPVPFNTLFDDRDWVRPDYVPYWHSLQGKGGSVPDLIHNSRRRLFVTPATEILWNETVYHSGIQDPANKIKLPVVNGNPGNSLIIVTFNHQVTDIFIRHSQVVLLGVPSRHGIQILSVRVKDLVPSISGEVLARNSGGKYIFQLVTPDGYEIDYADVMVSY